MTSQKEPIAAELSGLSEKEELLLSKYYDGECGVFSAFFAKSLVGRKKAARNFLDTLKRCSHTLQSESSTSGPSSPDLWARIDQRIHQEEKTALYLGARRAPDRVLSLLERLRGSPVAVGGFSGAAIAAATLFLVYAPKEISSFSVPFSAPFSNSTNQFQQVGFGNSQGSARGAEFAQIGNQALEVDWMRSNGSLSLIPGANGSSAVIWVRRRAEIPAKARNHAALRPTPLGRAEPTATISAHREWLDGKQLNSAK